jgi:hypothetical protein
MERHEGEIPKVNTQLELEEYRQDLGKFIAASSTSLARLGWDHFIAASRGETNRSPGVANIRHPASSFLHHLGQAGAPVVMATPP